MMRRPPGGSRLASLLVNPSRVLLQRFVDRAAEATPAGALVLDAGSGDCLYKPSFAHARYESADFLAVDKRYEQPTYVCDLASIPCEDGRYDTVLCTQVLEHLAEPERVLRELHRVLRVGGQLWLSTPFYYEEHEEPHDYFRYTRHGLRALLEAAGFEVAEIEPLEGYLATAGYQLHVASHVARQAWWLLPLRLALLGASAALSRLELRYRVAGGHPKNFVAVAHKPPRPGPALAR